MNTFVPAPVKKSTVLVAVRFSVAKAIGVVAEEVTLEVTPTVWKFSKLAAEAAVRA